MSVIDELGDELARKTIAAMEELGNDRLYNDVSKVIGASSPTLQEAYMTSIRVRLAALRGDRFIDETLKARREGGAPPGRTQGHVPRTRRRALNALPARRSPVGSGAAG